MARTALSIVANNRKATEAMDMMLGAEADSTDGKELATVVTALRRAETNQMPEMLLARAGEGHPPGRPGGGRMCVHPAVISSSSSTAVPLYRTISTQASSAKAI